MTGGTLLVSRAANLFPHFSDRLNSLGFQNVSVTGEEKDSLNGIINELKPRLVIMASTFYKSATPYMMGRLLKLFPGLNIAAVSSSEYPDDLAMWFIYHGVKSYLKIWDGPEEFYRGLSAIRDGKSYISPKVIERMETRREPPKIIDKPTARQGEILKLLCNGFTTEEIGSTLQISPRTVETHKTALYGIFHVRNDRELIRIAHYLDLIRIDELCFFGGNFRLTPLADKQLSRRNDRSMSVFRARD